MCLLVVSMLTACASVAAAADLVPEPAPALNTAERTRLLVLDLKGNDIDAGTTKTIQGVVTTDLAHYQELDVISGEDVKQLVQLQAEKSTVGCSDDAGCLAEIADALGAQLVVFGTVGKLGDAIVVNLNLFDAVKASGLGRVVVQTDDTKQLPKRLRPKLHELLGRFYREHGLTLPVLPVENNEAPVAVSEPSPLPFILAAGGGTTTLAGLSLVAIGLIPLLQYDDAKKRVLAAEQQFGADASAVTAGKAAQADLGDARSAWNSTGYLASDAGLALVAIGVPIAIWGLTWALTDAPTVQSAP